MEELFWSARNPNIRHLWDELERLLCTRPQGPASLDLTDAAVAKRERIPATRLRNQVERLRQEGWRLLEQHINAHMGLIFW